MPTAGGAALTTDRWRSRLLPALLPPLLAFVVFSPSIPSGFSLWDDQIQIVLNPFVRSHLPLGQQLLNLVGRDISAFVSVRGRGNYYRPLMQLAYWAEYRLWRLTAWAYHVVNLLLNSLVAFLAFLVLKEMLAGRRPREETHSPTTWAASAGAMLFAVHPLHAEPVAWLAALPELEFSAFYLLAFWAYLRALHGSARRRTAYLAAAGLASLLAYLSKEMAVTLPLLVALHLCLIVRWPWNRRTILLRAMMLAPFVLMLISYFGIRYWALGGRLGLERPQQAPWSTALLSVPTLFGRYCAKIVFPYPLSVAYPFTPTSSLLEPFLWLGLATLALAVWLWRKGLRLAALGILWVGVTLLPAINIRSVGDELPIADRYAYLPVLGLSLLLAIAWMRASAMIATLKIRRLAAGAVAVILVCFSGLSAARSLQWNDQVELFSRGLERAPAYWLYPVVGNTLLSQERWAEALVAFQKALAAGGGHTLRSDSYNGMAFARLQLGDLEGARRDLQRALLINPNSQHARYNIALVHREFGEWAAAQREIEICLRINPYSIEAHVLAGQVAVGQQDPARARHHFERAVRLDPRNREARAQLAALSKQK